ncbi:MAG: hypothetical protein HY805_08025 [Nitrospirae bacterium]|nr:hypothetical protein [Nitrospirota bacterium]
MGRILRRRLLGLVAIGGFGLVLVGCMPMMTSGSAKKELILTKEIQLEEAREKAEKACREVKLIPNYGGMPILGGLIQERRDYLGCAGLKSYGLNISLKNENDLVKKVEVIGNVHGSYWTFFFIPLQDEEKVRQELNEKINDTINKYFSTLKNMGIE